MKPIYYNETPTAKIVVYDNGKVFVKRYVEKFNMESGSTFKEWGEWKELEDLPHNEIKHGDTIKFICGAETEDVKFGEITLHANGQNYKFKPLN